jgi:hypothetical protein
VAAAQCVHIQLCSDLADVGAVHADVEGTSEEPMQPVQVWKLMMIADMVHNGFPLTDALGRKSYLGNLMVSQPLFVPLQVQHVKQNVSSAGDSRGNIHTSVLLVIYK